MTQCIDKSTQWMALKWTSDATVMTMSAGKQHISYRIKQGIALPWIALYRLFKVDRIRRDMMGWDGMGQDRIG